MKRTVGVGAGGHAKVVIDILRLTGGIDLVGLLDAEGELWGTTVEGLLVLGGDELLPKLYGKGVGYAFIGVGAVGDTQPRRRLYEMTRQCGFEMLKAVHPQAVVASSAFVGDGTSIMAHAVVNPGAHLGVDVIINSGAIVEHDCVVESHAHVATGSRLGGGVYIGEGSHVGIGASLRQGIRIGRNAIVGAGAAVVEDVPDSVVVAGVPAKILRDVEV